MEAAKRFGTTNILVNTFNKVWIVPQKAVVYKNAPGFIPVIINIEPMADIKVFLGLKDSAGKNEQLAGV